MSFKLVDSVFDLELPLAEKIVLAVLCKHANDDGSSTFPSIKTIAYLSSLKERATQRALRSLENTFKCIVAESEKRGGRHGQTVRYRIIHPDLETDAYVREYGTGALKTPVNDNTGALKTPTGARATPTGALKTPTGVLDAPNSVIYSVIDSVPESVKKESSSGSRDTDLSVFRFFLNAWQDKNGSPLRLGKQDKANLQKIIAAHGETQVYFGWCEFLTADPAPYRITALEIPRERTSKAGRNYTETVTDESAITKFPLSVFLKNPESYLLAGENTLAKNKTGKAPLEWARTIYGLK